MNPGRPQLTQARAPLTCPLQALNEHGQQVTLAMPAERALTVYVDKRELVTLMTLGAHPEWLVLGYLRNQQLVASVEEVASITVDWDVGAAAVRTHAGLARLDERSSRRVVTTGCGQGSIYGRLMDEVDGFRLPGGQGITQAQLYSLVNIIRLTETTYKSAGSVHACALFGLQHETPEMLFFVEDVGRHNALDTIAGWSWMHPAQAQGPQALYTTGRLTSEMVIKAAQLGVPVAISRSGITQMGHQMAQQLGVCAIGRATHRRFFCYSHPERLVLQAELAAAST